MTLTLERTETLEADRQSLQLCVLGSSRAEIEGLQEIAGHCGYASSGTSDPQQALAEINHHCRIVLADMDLPTLGGFAFLEQALQRDPGTFVILVANEDSIDAAIEAIRKGAYDYLRKPVNPARLKKTLDELHDRLCRRRVGDQPAQNSADLDSWQPLPLEEVRKQHIRRTLEVCGGNRVRAAQLLGIGRTSLYRHLKREHKNSSGRSDVAIENRVLVSAN
jgi:DNA-binding NtrC family response regulator